MLRCRKRSAARISPRSEPYLPVAAVFENRMAIPGSTAVLVLGLLAAWRHGYPILGFIQGGAVSWVLVSLVLFLTIIPVIVLVFVPSGRVFKAALNDAVARGRVTPELHAAFRDPIVRAAHYYELGVVSVILALMVLKPF